MPNDTATPGTAHNALRISYLRRPNGWEGCVRNGRGLVELTCGHVHQVRGFADRLTGAETCMRLQMASAGGGTGAWVLVTSGTPFTGRVVSVDGHRVTVRRDVPYVDYQGKAHEIVVMPVHSVDPWVPAYK